MKNHKLELTFAGIFLVIYLVMIGGYNFFETNFVYDEITGLLFLASIFLISWVSWKKFKKTLK